MLFNSAVFLVFAGVFFALWPAARRRPVVRYGFLILSSIVFYAWWDWRFLLLIAGTGLVDFFVARAMSGRERGRRALLALSLACNLGSLAVFKYSGFVADALTSATALLGLQLELRAHLPEFVLILPVGISFYTFQALTYTIDVYQRKLEPARNVLQYFAFKSLWPLLLAGPIMRAADLLPQLAAARPATPDDRREGLRLVVYGFFQKLVLADGLAPYVNYAFSARQPAESALYWWLIVAAYAFQIYCDFGGYSNIARGLGKWMGCDFVDNFRHPYGARSLGEFWQRWHVSLSQWIWRYLFTPLTYAFLRRVDRMNLPTVEQEMRVAYPAAALLAMGLCGLWHGAGLTFVAWGLLHGIYLSIERLTNWPKWVKRLPAGPHVATLLVLLQVWVAWVFFRAGSFEQAAAVLRRLFGFAGGLSGPLATMGGVGLLNLSLLLALATGREMWHYFRIDQRRLVPERWQEALEPWALALLVAAAVFLRGPGGRFIYFQF